MASAPKLSETTTTQTYSGIAPSLLLRQVFSSAPYLPAEGGFGELLHSFIKNDNENWPPLPEYFKLCIAAHFATVASFLPTDLDPTIRLKLWKEATADQHREMLGSVLEFDQWNEEKVSLKWVKTPAGKKLSGHTGEWFTLFVPAYFHTQDEKLWQRFVERFEEHQEILTELKEAGLWNDYARAATIMAHNFGDLDRSIDLWNLAPDHELRKFYKKGNTEVNKSLMAAENHRHFALRIPKGLRKSSDLVLPIGPFFDSWGRLVGRHPSLSENERLEIVDALLDGFARVNSKEPSVGYGRALAGLISVWSGGERSLNSALRANARKILQSPEIRKILNVQEKAFEESFAQRVKKLIAN